MTWFVDTRKIRKTRPDMIGPGRLILVVGPSGAGKDTLIDGARTACAGDQSVIFPRRVVSRSPSDKEDHESMSVDEFDQAKLRGAFALWWEAHNHSYGIRSEIDDDIRAGRTVVCNVSRTIVSLVRHRYSDVAVVMVTAPDEVLKSRLTERDRSSDGDIAERIARSAKFAHSADTDFVIHNTSWPQVGVRRLMNIIRDPGFFVVS